jgi:hypothetical protein
MLTLSEQKKYLAILALLVVTVLLTKAENRFLNLIVVLIWGFVALSVAIKIHKR